MEIIDWLNHHCLRRQISITITTLVSNCLLSILLAISLKTTTSSMPIFINFHRFLLIFQLIPQQALIRFHYCSTTPSLNCFAARYSPNLTLEFLHFLRMIWSAQRSKFEAGCSSSAKELLQLGMEKICSCRRICGSFPCRG